MPNENYVGKPLQDIVSKLTDYAPLKLAETWDNVGLLVDPMSSVNVKNILLTNDATEDVVDEATNLNVGLIISYHPNIFQGLKSVSSRTWKERIVVKCLQNNIAVFSPHTSWDSVHGGVNDWLGDAFDFEVSVPIIPNTENPKYGSGRICTLKHPITLEDSIKRVKNHIGISHLRLAVAKGKDQSDAVSSVALCAGSGSSVLKGVKSNLYVTGEMLHHDILEATQNGIHVILCNHSDSERGFLKSFQSILTEMLNKEVGVFVSNVDCDPLITV
ncbi:hypothetical protein RN001_012678 [Aquatica leii]|uniref:NIF3-like protein 1 n=1 Tax=Aquatica leii TaxID=1421715 RepID=A0AAN7S7W0_9COLE|nr:hypothetical protein RN001_012678 [Aquatica leii]